MFAALSSIWTAGIASTGPIAGPVIRARAMVSRTRIVVKNASNDTTGWSAAISCTTGGL